MSDWWDELAVAALLGTDRRPQLETGALPDRLAVAVKGLVGDPADVLLAAAALAVAYRRGGMLAEPAVPEPERAPAETLRRPTPRAAGLLAQALATDLNLARFWCETAAAAGLGRTAAQLPALLDRAVGGTGISSTLGTAGAATFRAAVLAVLGERGIWLARQRPNWAVVVPQSLGRELDPRDWYLGTTGFGGVGSGGSAGSSGSAGFAGSASSGGSAGPSGAGGSSGSAGQSGRAGWLRAARQADPALGLAALTATWPSEAARDRAALLDLLADGLGPADEALLETALDDPVTAVRRSAAELLAALPTSGYGDRMRARSALLVHREPGLIRHRVAIRAPGQLDPQAARDGITDVPPAGPVEAGSRARWWLEQVVAGTPLGFWEQVFGSPEQAVGARLDPALQPAVLAGWAAAAVRQRDPRWGRALLATGSRQLTGALLSLLTGEELSAAIRSRLAELAPADLGSLVDLLSACPGPWPGSLAGAVLDWLLGAVPHFSSYTPGARPLLELIAYRFPATDRAAALVVAAAQDVADDLWRHRLADVAATLSARTQILEELQ